MEPRLTFNIDNILLALRHSEIVHPFQHADDLIEHLSNYRSINLPSFSLLQQFVYVYGFGQIVEFLSRCIHTNSSVTFNPPSVNDLNFSSLDLKPTVEKKSSEKEDSGIWVTDKNETERVELNYGAEKEFQTKLPDFYNVEWMKVRVNYYGLILRYGQDMTASLAIVRRLEADCENSNIQKGVIEKLIGKLTLVEIAGGTKKGVLLTNQDSYELILPSGKYVTGTVLKLQQGEVVLSKMMEYSSEFVRYSVDFKVH